MILIRETVFEKRRSAATSQSCHFTKPKLGKRPFLRQQLHKLVQVLCSKLVQDILPLFPYFYRFSGLGDRLCRFFWFFFSLIFLLFYRVLLVFLVLLPPSSSIFLLLRSSLFILVVFVFHIFFFLRLRLPSSFFILLFFIFRIICHPSPSFSFFVIHHMIIDHCLLNYYLYYYYCYC